VPDIGKKPGSKISPPPLMKIAPPPAEGEKTKTKSTKQTSDAKTTKKMGLADVKHPAEKSLTTKSLVDGSKYKEHMMKFKPKNMSEADYKKKLMASAKFMGHQDSSTSKAIAHLQQQLHTTVSHDGVTVWKKPNISGKDIEKLVQRGTEDADKQEAGREYTDLKNFISRYGSRMTPSAKAKWRVYENTVKTWQAKGKSGIPKLDYNIMLARMRRTGYTDASVAKTIEAFEAKGKKTISGQDMQQIIHQGTKDPDGQLLGKEYNDIKNYVTQNWHRLDHNAKAKWGVYDKTVQTAKAQGKNSIDNKAYDKMLSDIKAAGYQDASAGRAIEAFKAKNKQQITATDFRLLLYNAIQDFDKKEATAEYRDIRKFVQDNWNKMTADAKMCWRGYSFTAGKLSKQGKSGFPTERYVVDLVRRMSTLHHADESAGQVVENTFRKLMEGTIKKISGNDMNEIITLATRDRDGQEAGKEYDVLNNFVDKAWKNMSKAAKAKWKAYEDAVNVLRSKGQKAMPTKLYLQVMGKVYNAGND